jgi:glutamate dehydrogenase
MEERDSQILERAIERERELFQRQFHWLEENMSAIFFEEIPQDWLMLITHSLIGFHLQDFYTAIHLKNAALVLVRNSPDADLRILSEYRNYGIKNYRAYVSKTAPEGCSGPIRVGAIYFTEAVETMEVAFAPQKREELRQLVEQRNPDLSQQEFDRLIAGINTRFLGSLKLDHLTLALDMFFRAKTRDHCQYEVRYNEGWRERNEPSMYIVLAWRNTPKHGFLYRLAQVVYRHKLVMRQVNATYLDPYRKHSILVMFLGLHGSNGEAAWEAADIPDFLRELVTLKYFSADHLIEKTFVQSGLLRGNLGNLLHTLHALIHQILVHVDPNLFSFENVEEGLCRHPELAIKLCEAFEYKFHPDYHDLKKCDLLLDELQTQVQRLDTGHEVNDTRRRSVLEQAINVVRHTLKTNFYRNNKTALSFRLDPHYLDHTPFNRFEKFPELPFAIFFVKGMQYFGFHIRFRDLARGGLRTVMPERHEQMVVERDHVFSECYNLAYTQQKKNKDIPEGGAKAIIFLKPTDHIESEAKILANEMTIAGKSQEEIVKRLDVFRAEQKIEYLYQTQRTFVNSLLTLINCQPDGTLKAKHVVDYYKRPEYIYLGPDENMHSGMIEWIAEHSKAYHYKPGSSFISSKPRIGINHKEYGVTSLGVNTYMHEVLLYLGIDPTKDRFTIKISGGPDGDVAGNQIYNLYKYYRNTARLVALTDVSGTINDPSGLDLEEMVRLFKEGLPICHYPPEKLSEGGFLLDRTRKRDTSAYVQHTLCWRKQRGEVVQDWLPGSDMNRLFHRNVHETKADVFVPGGGRPRTLNEFNYTEFLDPVDYIPTSRAIIEGANLYLTAGARRKLEELGCIIIKDSSANKGGVICSSFEVLYGLVLTEEEMLGHKEVLVQEILEILQARALDEARLLLRTHQETGSFLTDISEWISTRINEFTDQLFNYLEGIELSEDPNDPLNRCFLLYCPPFLRNHATERLLTEIPPTHKKAIIACRIAAQLVYRRGLAWSPSIVDVLPTLTKALTTGDFD